jgi:hypothetical protein
MSGERARPWAYRWGVDKKLLGGVQMQQFRMMTCTQVQLNDRKHIMYSMGCTCTSACTNAVDQQRKWSVSFVATTAMLGVTCVQGNRHWETQYACVQCADVAVLAA